MSIENLWQKFHEASLRHREEQSSDSYKKMILAEEAFMEARDNEPFIQRIPVH